MSALSEIGRAFSSFTMVRDLVFPYQDFLNFCRRQVCGVVEFYTAGSDSLGNDDELDGLSISELEQTPLSEANIVCSDLKGRYDLHMPVLDLDMPAMLIESSTPGHHHLYIDKPMNWEQYVKLLDVLAEVGILEQGYVNVSKKRGRTQVRTPWTSK